MTTPFRSCNKVRTTNFTWRPERTTKEACYPERKNCTGTNPPTASYNALNQVTWTSVNAAVNGLTYDAAGNVYYDGLNTYAYDAEGTALHTISDRTSPAHEGEQVWTGAGEPGASSLAGPLGTLAGAITDGVRAEIHVEEESTITLDQYHTTIDDERAAYLQTFGQDAFTQATGCKQVAGCGYNDSALPANLKKPQ